MKNLSFGKYVLGAQLFSFFYASVFYWTIFYVYKYWLAPTYSYMGFSFSRPETWIFLLSLFLALIPSLWLPMKARGASDFFIWMFYYFLYIPSEIIPPIQGLLPNGVFLLLICLFVSFTIISIFPPFSSRSIHPVDLTERSFWFAFYLVYLSLTVYVLYVYKGQMRLVSAADVYTQRALASGVQAGTLVGYAAGMLSGAFNPFLMGLGLTRRRYRLFSIGAAGQVLIFATAAMKSVFLSVLLIPIFYVAVLRGKPIRLYRVGLLCVISVLIPFLLGTATSGFSSSNDLIIQILALVFMRTYAMTGVITGVYADFFSRHPFTFFSHIHLFSIFHDYPFSQSLGEEIGYYLTGSDLDANANFFATDGIASLGNFGILIIGLFVGFILKLTDYMCGRENLGLVCCCVIPAIANMSNASFFTVFLSGGFAPLVVILYFWRSAQSAKPIVKLNTAIAGASQHHSAP